MRRLPTAIAALVVLGLLALGCASGDTRSTSAGTDTTSGPGTGVDVGDPAVRAWVDRFCTAMGEMAAGVTEVRPPELTPGTTPAEFRQAFAGQMQALLDAAQGPLSHLQALGPPPVPDGPALHAELVSAYTQPVTVFQRAVAAIHGIPDDPAAFRPYMAQVKPEIDALFEGARNPFEGLEERYPEATLALTANMSDSCAPLADLGAPAPRG